MMKSKNAFVCQQCGKAHSKWAGQCQDCGAWNSLVEELAPAKNSKQKGASTKPKPQSVKSITEISLSPVERMVSDISELDTVLGGGLVPGSVVLIGGEPGIGKSTLLLQAAAQYVKQGHKVLYVTGEESTSQIALRANRLSIEEKNLLILSETSLEQIINQIQKTKPTIIILDSIQTIFSTQMDSQPGSVGQLRECSNEIISLAKGNNIATFLVGHVTKEGAIAGPKVLEHMVDVVLYFDGNSVHSFRLCDRLKIVSVLQTKLAFFEMSGKGMQEVQNPSDLFLAERSAAIAGSAIVASMEGSRPILVEVQSLVSHSNLAMPRRTAIGMDHNRLSLLTAILDKRAGYRLADQDVFINIAGGIRLSEPAIDLGVVTATISSLNNKIIDKESLFFGEVGLGGEIRSVARAEQRLKEASRVGFKRAFAPERVVKDIKNDTPLELIPLGHIGQLSDYI